jgi:integrase
MGRAFIIPRPTSKGEKRYDVRWRRGGRAYGLQHGGVFTNKKRKVFQGATPPRIYQTMTRACKNAGVPHYHPHDLRHRRCSRWHQDGMSARELADRAGHSDPWMTLNVYSHVMPLEEVSKEQFLAVLKA